MLPAVGKSGPFIIFISAGRSVSGSSIMWMTPSMTSARLCGGIFVAMPTAIPEKPQGDRRQPGFGVTVGRRRVPIYRAEVALPVNERITHGEILGHPHQGGIDGRVAVRVIFLEDFADGRGALLIPPIWQHALVKHRV